MKKELTQDRLKQLLTYNAETGLFFWNKRGVSEFKNVQAFKSWNKKYRNKEAGSKRDKGLDSSYIIIRVDGKSRYAHRLAWLYHYGELPDFIDHIDGNKSNNSIKNLRSCTASENSHNIPDIGVGCGFKGVSFVAADNKWRARITIRENEINLGRFDSMIDAIAARIRADIDFKSNNNITREVFMGLARSKKIKNSARGECCSLRLEGVCNENSETVIFAHIGSHGGMGIKCGDNFGVYACSNCHDVIDGRVKMPEWIDNISYEKLRALEETQQKLINKGLLLIN